MKWDANEGNDAEKHFLSKGVSRDTSMLSYTCSNFNIDGNPIKFIAVNSRASQSSVYSRFMQLLNFRKELDLTTFVVYDQLNVNAL